MRQTSLAQSPMGHLIVSLIHRDRLKMKTVFGKNTSMHRKFDSINTYVPSFTLKIRDVPQGSSLAPLLFYMYNLTVAKQKFSLVTHIM